MLMFFIARTNKQTINVGLYLFILFVLNLAVYEVISVCLRLPEDIVNPHDPVSVCLLCVCVCAEYFKGTMIQHFPQYLPG